MTVTLQRPVLSGTVRAPASKSHIHRLIIASALYSEGARVLYSGELSEDISATVSCMRALGADITISHITDNDGEILIYPVNKRAPEDGLRAPARLDCGESGSTLRFLLPVACALGSDAEFYAEGRLPKRPLSPLRERLIEHGCTVSDEGSVPIRTHGKLGSGIYNISGNISSQYITGLMLALPLIKGESIIRIEGRLESRPYVDMTLDVMSRFGVNITERGTDFIINEGAAPADAAQEQANRTFHAEGDWSNGAFWLCAGAIGSAPVCVSGLTQDSAQGDRAVIDILKRFGAEITETERGICVFPSTLRATDIDASDIPDLVPILALTASCAEGRSVIYGAARLKLKESDRLEAVAELLSGLGADITATDDSLIINGGRSFGGYALKGGAADSHNDHRIAMTAAIASTVSEGPVTVSGAEAVNKSYRRFWDDFKALGGS